MKYRDDRPLVLGHRGAMAYAPMNTIPAFELALEQGADGVELDVWFSQDDVPVVIHDRTVDATTDGEGHVGSTPYDELRELDAGSWFAPEFAGLKIPTLDEVFDVLAGRAIVNVEIKSVSFNVGVPELVEKVVSSIRRHHMSDSVIISSFNPVVLRQCFKQAPELPRGFLYDHETAIYLRWMLFGVELQATHPGQKGVTSALVERAKRRNLRLNTWTVNDPARAAELAAMGVDTIITDNPDTVLAALS